MKRYYVCRSEDSIISGQYNTIVTLNFQQPIIGKHFELLFFSMLNTIHKC